MELQSFEKPYDLAEFRKLGDWGTASVYVLFVVMVTKSITIKY